MPYLTGLWIEHIEPSLLNATYSSLTDISGIGDGSCDIDGIPSVLPRESDKSSASDLTTFSFFFFFSSFSFTFFLRTARSNKAFGPKREEAFMNYTLNITKQINFTKKLDCRTDLYPVQEFTGLGVIPTCQLQ